MYGINLNCEKFTTPFKTWKKLKRGYEKSLSNDLVYFFNFFFNIAFSKKVFLFAYFALPYLLLKIHNTISEN